jgi:hypothetical protein
MPISAASNFINQGGIPIQMFNFALPALSFALTSFGLGIDWHYVALAVGGSVSGSVLLSYFRREKSRYEQLYKMVTSAIGGLIVGSAFIRYREMVEPSYIALAYFICSMLVLIILRTFLSLTEKNAATFTTTLIQRVFNIKLDGEKPKTPRHQRRNADHRESIHISDLAETGKLVIPDTAKPDEVKIIEQTVIENAKGE